MKIKLKKLIPVVMFVFPAIFIIMARTTATELTDPTVIGTNVTSKEIDVQFSKPLDSVSVRDSFVLKAVIPGVGFGTVAGKLVYDGVSAAKFIPQSELVHNLNYTLTLTGAEDPDGNPLDFNGWSFTGPDNSEAAIVLKDGFIYTADSNKSEAEALAIKDKKIIYVGSNAGVAEYIGPNTEVIYLAGKMVLPAFVDTHSHPAWGALGSDDSPAPPKEVVKEALLKLQYFFNSVGITTCHDATLVNNDPNIYESYNELAEAGLLTVRYRASWSVDPNEKSVQMIDQGIELAKQFNHPHFKAHSFKIFADGVIESRTGFLLEPYEGDPDYYGNKFWKDADMIAAYKKINEAGYQIHTHTIGDAAVRYTLDALEAAGITPEDRASLAHVQMATPEDIIRMGELGLSAHMSPYWHNKGDWDTSLSYLGSERANNQQYPHKSLFDAGVKVTCASDFAISDPIPGQAIFYGMTRGHNGTDGDTGGLGPLKERVSLEEMIESMTINGAYANFLENELGSVEVGKLADITVIDRDLFAAAEKDMQLVANLEVLMTLFEGKIVFRSPKW
ncbi:MAG: amidohydrolase family protein [Desulfobacterales bacterium]|nr:amidohydrolase family protein [Desulfobacterales bacterium]